MLLKSDQVRDKEAFFAGIGKEYPGRRGNAPGLGYRQLRLQATQ